MFNKPGVMMAKEQEEEIEHKNMLETNHEINLLLQLEAPRYRVKENISAMFLMEF